MFAAWKTCTGGVYCPGFGPPLAYEGGATRVVGATAVPLVGGNPDVTRFLQGKVKAPGPHESGWKDTVMALPGQVTRFVVRWAPGDKPVSAAPRAQQSFPFDPSSDIGYVWHCHIIDREDIEMMRPDVTQPNPPGPVLQDRLYEQGIDC